jgi:hypothetical protein
MRPAHWQRAFISGSVVSTAGEAAAPLGVSYNDYRALERTTDTRYTSCNGQIYAMAGRTITHGELAAETMGEPRSLAMACGCRVLSSDVKPRVRATGFATYPDASMVCGAVERNAEDQNAITNTVSPRQSTWWINELCGLTFVLELHDAHWHDHNDTRSLRRPTTSRKTHRDDCRRVARRVCAQRNDAG